MIETKVDVDRTLQSAIRRYYSQTRVSVPDIDKREFGVSKERGRKIQTRHISFPNTSALNEFLRKEAPYYVSYSVALYRFPSADYEEAGFIGADWVFEFDMENLIDDDLAYCPHCDEVYRVGELADPTKCPRCGRPTNIIRIPDPSRYRAGARHTKRLIEILRGDFGLDADSVRVNFSGNRGFHIHVTNEEWEGFPKEAREEIAEYLRAEVDPHYFLYLEGNRPYLYLHGLMGRIARRLMKRFPHEVRGDRVYFRADYYTLCNAVLDASEKEALPIDVHTTTDIHRLIRVPDTVHGGTGLIAKTIEDPSEFDPFRDAVLPINARVEVKVRYLPKIRWAGETLGPYENETAELPVTLLFYLTQK